MTKKRATKETINNSNTISNSKEKTPILVNGYSVENNIDESVTKSKLGKSCKFMDYRTYLTLRRNGITPEPTLMNTRERKETNLSTSTSEQSSEDSTCESPGYVFDFYRKFATDYWNVFPKTDYTYSSSSSFYNKQIAPGIPTVPNLARSPLNHSPKDVNSSSSTNSKLPSSSDLEQRDGITSRTFTTNYQHSVGRSRNSAMNRCDNWYRNSWIKRSFETVKTVTITIITTTIETTTETVMHPTRRPYIILPLFLLLLPLLFYILFLIDIDEKEEPIVPWTATSLEWLETLIPDKNSLDTITSFIVNPFVSTYNFAFACLHLILTCLSMIPTILSQLVYSLNLCLILFFQRISGWCTQEISIIAPFAPRTSINTKSSEKITNTVDYGEIRRIVMEVLSEREQNGGVLSDLKVPTNDQVKVLNDIIQRFSDKFLSLESNSKDQKKAMDEIFLELKILGEKLAAFQLQLSSQTAEVARGGGTNTDMTSMGWSEISENVSHLVKSILKQYHADRTGRPDFALMSNGGTIISIGCTKTYTSDSGKIYFPLLGFPLWNVHTNPDVIIKPGIMPGECWAFEGSIGYVTIGLAMPIYITGFTMEHTPKELTPHGNIKSAPNRFSVWALKELKDNEPLFLGRFQFLDNGESLQYFEAEIIQEPIHMVELKIESNHGSINYTCLYRFRVHGTPST